MNFRKVNVPKIKRNNEKKQETNSEIEQNITMNNWFDLF